MNWRSNKKTLLLPLSIFALSLFAKFSTAPVFIDEYATVFLSSGIPVDNLNQLNNGYRIEKYNSITNQQIKAQNTLRNLFNNSVRDGGNSIGFYLLIRAVSLSLGNVLGVFNASRLFCIFIGILTLLMLYRLTNLIAGHQTAIIACTLFAISPMAIYHASFIRSYGTSALIIVTLFYLGIKLISPPYQLDWRSYVLLFLLVAITPFFHFFNAIFIVLLALFLLIEWKTDLNKKARLIGSFGVAVLPFLYFYFFLNEEGREYQAFLNNFWAEYSSRYGESGDFWKMYYEVYGVYENDWLYPAKPRFIAYEMSELFSNLLSIDLSKVFPALRMRYQLPFLLLFFFYFIKIGYPKKRMDYWLLLIPTTFILTYLFLAVWSGHVTSLNNLHYSYLFYPFVTIFISETIQKGIKKKGTLRLLIYIYLGMVLAIYIGHVLEPYQQLTGPLHEEGDMIISPHKETLLLEAIERQFDQDTIYFTYER